ncbi:MAG: FtsW/RodA/SpoVE family cell cycle protein [Bacteroidota bacterium]
MVGGFRKYFKGDNVIWVVILLLSIISLLAVYSSTGTLAFRYKEGNTAYYILKHATFLSFGLIIIFIVHLIPYKIYIGLSQLLLLIAIPLLLITLLIGTNLNQASRWLTVPGLGLTFQTSDFAKLALIMYVARILSQRQDRIRDFKEVFLPVIIPVLIITLLILPANFSTAALVFITCMFLMFIGRIPFKYLLSLSIIGITAIGLFIVIALAVDSEGRIETWKHRVENYIDKDSEGNYQANQAKIAIATGGVLGKGPGNSTQRYFLPHPYSDFIYAIIAEEYGLTGAVFVLFMYLYLLYRAGVIVRKSERTFPAFLAVGLSMLLVFQAMVNMAVSVNLLPVTGQTLPLVSMGGSSLLFTSISLGIILSVSRNIKSKSAKKLNSDDKEEVEDAA